MELNEIDRLIELSQHLESVNLSMEYLDSEE
jgi:hypothetical protein